MSATVFERIEELLTRANVAYKVTRHEPVFTSEQAAAVRGVALGSGAKALVVKAGERFFLLVIPADRKLDNRKAKAALGVRDLRFASKEEVLEITGLQPGSIPPFGSLFNLPTHLEPALSEHADINFNAGDHTISVQMRYADYLAVEKPTPAALT